MEPKTTKRYMAEYTVRSCMMDGVFLMPDPEPHQERRNFEAADDAEAKKKAEGYKPEIAKDYYDPSITLESVSEVREVELQKPEQMPLEQRVREVKFDEKKRFVVDEQGQKYTGKKFRWVSAWSSLGGFPSRENACHDALEKIETLAQKAGADAYEITGKDVHDTQQEYDPKPYTVCVTAILYRRGKPMPKQTPLEARERLKKLKFDGISESLVDAEGKKYSGKRLRNVSVHSVSGFSDRYDILSKLEDLALEYGADAYELIDYLNEQEIQQKFGSTPYTPPATAILYRRG